MIYTKKLILFFLVSTIFFTGCSNRVTLSHKKDRLSLSAHIDAGITVLQLAGKKNLLSNSDDSLFNALTIKQGLEKNGFNDVSVTSVSKSAADVSCAILYANKELNKISSFITIKENTIQISLSPEIIRSTISNLPAEAADCANILMAPVLTGERMSQSEYISLLSATYGQSVANEIKTSSFSFTVVPLNGSKNKTIVISLLDLLTLDSIRTFEFPW